MLPHAKPAAILNRVEKAVSALQKRDSIGFPKNAAGLNFLALHPADLPQWEAGHESALDVLRARRPSSQGQTAGRR